MGSGDIINLSVFLGIAIAFLVCYWIYTDVFEKEVGSCGCLAVIFVVVAILVSMGLSVVLVTAITGNPP